ncbi:DUF885 family protein [Actinophytocola algeriensis]|uniref:Uncharacterized protein (DUF885 family) n=1 Tax=Actinophytocola algeriensis TaxID=1768010 RepID=A0A7W7Q3K0_9PSEU|nr:DUF885 family protein [Actinophytocola algeriensis]MBB4906183.1 uncharacterized protein (DUF885 family) [Actinophytocola algeriensis]MBE1472132.1 uncharacterized protein (DUF885 family) [Actinophytocola algeriensis]
MSTQADIGTANAAVSSVVDHIFSHHPHVARRAGSHEFDGVLPEVGPHPVGALDDLLATARAELAALPATADPELRADLDAAVHVLGSERFPAAALGRAWPGPLTWLGATDVPGLPDAGHPSLVDRMAALRAQLAGLPRFLEQAAGTVADRLPAGERLIGIEYARAQAARLEDVGRVVARDHSGYAEDGIAVAAAEAAAACRRYAEAVAAAEPANLLYGPELLDEFLQVTQGVDQQAEELLDHAETEVAALVARLDALAARLGVSGRGEAFDLLRAEVSAAPVPDVLTATIARLREFWARADVVSVDTATPLEVRRAPRLTGAARVEFSISPPLARDRAPHVLWVPEPDSGHGDVRVRFLNDPMLEVIAVHEAVPGHYVQIEAVTRGPSVLRACVPWFPAFTEGWGHYVEELAIERGLAEGRPLVEVAQLRSALEATTRLLVFLAVHMGRTSFGASVTRAMALCGWSAERAAREVVIVAADPGGAMYALGKSRIRAWRREVGTGRPALKEFHDRLVACGNVPLSTALRYYRDGLAHTDDTDTGS